MTSRPKIALIGGGTGSFALLGGLKNLDADITALVNMVDDGGSTGQLRDEYGVLPPGDVRQCLVALSDAPMSLRNLFNFRFPADSSLGGHSFGNLFLSAVELMTDNFAESIKVASEVLSIKGHVVPVTTVKCQLVLEAEGGSITGQRTIELTSIKPGSKPQLKLDPRAALSSDAKKAIAEAQIVIIAPGSLYCSIIPALLVEGMPKALKETKATIILVSNLVNKPNHTKGFKVNDYLSEIERFIGDGVIDYLLYNTDMPSEDLLKKYAEEHEYPVEIDSEQLERGIYKAVAGNFLSHKPETQDKNDILIKRSLLRHDGRAIARVVQGILGNSI